MKTAFNCEITNVSRVAASLAARPECLHQPNYIYFQHGNTQASCSSAYLEHLFKIYFSPLMPNNPNAATCSAAYEAPGVYMFYSETGFECITGPSGS